jgi:putative membrane protein
MTWFLNVMATQPVDHSWGQGGWWWIPFALLFWGGVATIAWYLLFHVRAPRQQSGVERARDILAERLARGEISADEYYERLSALS